MDLGSGQGDPSEAGHFGCIISSPRRNIGLNLKLNTFRTTNRSRSCDCGSASAAPSLAPKSTSTMVCKIAICESLARALLESSFRESEQSLSQDDLRKHDIWPVINPGFRSQLMSRLDNIVAMPCTWPVAAMCRRNCSQTVRETACKPKVRSAASER